jgi:N-acetylglucosaminyl-diphospho-decaprenol L-rhamnosyltransferase
LSASTKRRLSALFVNHSSGAWTLRAVESLQLEWARDGRDPSDLEVIVVDSGSRPGEETWWRSLERLGARVLRSRENIGYASGLNLAYRESTGERDDVVALLNPDLYFPAGSVRPLMERLATAHDVTMVAPRCFVDEARCLRLPPNELPSPKLELGDLEASRMPRFARRLLAARSERARRFWSAELPLRQEMLSGACLFLRRRTVEELGSPMDGAYPLYFEDADLCARLRKAGGRLELVPEAEVLHHWSRSAGPNFAGAIAERWATSRARFHRAHSRGPLDLLARAAHALLERKLSQLAPRTTHPVLKLGTVAEAPRFQIGREGRYQLELSLTPFWGLSAGAIFEGDGFELPARTWAWLFPGTYYARVVDLETGEFVGAWQFQKSSVARSWPIDPKSLPQPRQVGRRDSLPPAGERVG